MAIFLALHPLLIFVACVGVSADRTEASRRAAVAARQAHQRVAPVGEAAQPAHRFQDLGDIPLSRLQLEEQAESNTQTMSCQTVEAMHTETSMLKAKLLARMTQEHGVQLSSSLNRALSKKGGSSTPCEAAKKGKDSGEDEEARTKKLYSLKRDELVQYWLPQDCRAVESVEKDLGSTKKQEQGSPAPEQQTPESEEALKEEASLERNCDKMKSFLNKAAFYMQHIKNMAAKDDENMKKKQKAEQDEGTKGEEQGKEAGGDAPKEKKPDGATNAAAKDEVPKKKKKPDGATNAAAKDEVPKKKNPDGATNAAAKDEVPPKQKGSALLEAISSDALLSSNEEVDQLMSAAVELAESVHKQLPKSVDIGDDDDFPEAKVAKVEVLPGGQVKQSEVNKHSS